MNFIAIVFVFAHPKKTVAGKNHWVVGHKWLFGEIATLDLVPSVKGSKLMPGCIYITLYIVTCIRSEVTEKSIISLNYYTQDVGNKGSGWVVG